MPLLEFETPRQRIERARLHSDNFRGLWNQLVEQDEAYSVVVRVNADGTGGIFVEPRESGLPAVLALELGEFLYQLRAALDACIYAAAILETGLDPPPKEEQLEFPIYSDPAGAKKLRDASRKFAPLTGKRREIVESVQPFNAPDIDDELRVFSIHRTLEILNDWARRDRHRKLHLVGGWASEANPQLRLPDGVDLDWLMVTYDGLLEGDSQIAAFKLDGYKSAEETKIQAKPDVYVDIAVGESPEPCAHNDTLANRIRMMIACVSEVVGAFEESFIEDRRVSRSGL